MELNSEFLNLVLGGGNGGGAGSPDLPKKKESQSVDRISLDSSLESDPTKPVEPPKP